MTVKLEEQLQRIAESAQTSEEGVDELWRRGRLLRHRRQFTSTALAVAIFIAGSVTAVGFWQSSNGRPDVADSSRVFLPDRLYVPGKWLQGTKDAGPLGPLSVVMNAERGQILSRARYAVVGVAARTGEYRFLDLPDMNELFVGKPKALSPDGRYLAYWVPDKRYADRSDVAVGFNVYDTTTGEVRRFLEPGQWGLATGDFSWTGTRLWVEYGVIDKLRDNGYSSKLARGSVDVSVQSADFEASSTQNLPATSPVTDIWIQGNGKLRKGDPDAQQPRATYPLSQQLDSLAIGPSGQYLAGLEANMDPGRVLVGAVPTSADLIEMAVAPAAPEAYEILGWRDEETVLLLAQDPFLPQAYGLMAFNVNTEETATLTRLSYNVQTPIVAQDALVASVQPTREPDWPLNPRINYGALTLMVLAALVAGLLGWRRRAVW